jgi:hypothetical protein
MSEQLQSELRRASFGLPGGRSFRLLTRHDAETLLVFYRLLSGDERRLRFGGAVSNDSIAKYCAGIDWNRSILIARAGPYCLEAVATVVRIDKDRVETAIACPNVCNPAAIVPALLDLSAIAARTAFGARYMLIFSDQGLDFLDAMGGITVKEDHVLVELSQQPFATLVDSVDRRRRERGFGEMQAVSD